MAHLLLINEPIETTSGNNLVCWSPLTPGWLRASHPSTPRRVGQRRRGTGGDSRGRPRRGTSVEHVVNGRVPASLSNVICQVNASVGEQAPAMVRSRPGALAVEQRRAGQRRIRYVCRTGCQWDALPIDLAPWPLLRHSFRTWTRDGTLNRMHNALREQIRRVEGRNPQPSAALVTPNPCAVPTPESAT